ncbi:MAG: 50S ribosomal protein L11 methyltransferase [Bryobacteraceae bacterium]
MFSLELECTTEERDLLIAELWERDPAGVVESELSVRAFFEDDADERALIERFAGRRPALRREENRDWVAFSRSLWEPRLVGERLFLVPEWRDDPTPPGRVRIPVNPGLACGTGAHEATRLCLEALEDYLRPGMSVLDVGTGSGILSLAAVLLGAGHVIACDDDPAATAVARSRLPPGVALLTGSLDAVAPETADLILCNISAEAAIELADGFARCLRTGGAALISGFQADREEEVAQALATVRERRTEGEWRLLISTRVT